MDLHQPIIPDLEGFRAKVLAIKDSPFQDFYCCICRGPHAGRYGICANPKCREEARRLDWLLP